MRSMNTYTKPFLLALLIFVAFRVYPQKVITEFEFGNTSLDKLSGMIFNDSLFLGGELMSMGAPTVKVSYWVRKDGSKRKVDFSKLGGKSIFAVSATDYEEYYYYLVEERKSVFINALIIDKKTGSSRIGEKGIKLLGNVYGSFIEDNDLFLLSSVKGSYILKITRIQGLSIKNEHPYSLTFDLGSQSTENVRLKVTGTEFVPSNGTSPIKITKEREAIWISIDEPRGQYDQTELGTTLYRTTVVKIDIKNPDMSFVRSFVETTSSYFSSVIFNGVLFRVYNDNYYHFDAFDVMTGVKIFSRSFTRKSEFGNGASIYVRSEDDNSVKKTLTTKPLTEFGLSFVSVDTISSDGYVLTAGSSGLIKPSTPLIHNMGLIGLVASAATQAMVRELSEGQRFYVYSHIKINLDGSLNFTTESNTLVQKIDDYEIQNFKEKMEYKGYLATVGSVFAFYKVKKSNKFQIVQFER